MKKFIFLLSITDYFVINIAFLRNRLNPNILMIRMLYYTIYNIIIIQTGVLYEKNYIFAE